MKDLLQTTTLLCFFILFAETTYGQGFLRAEGKEIVDESGNPYILKGMGLGGWMLQEGYMLQTAGFANAQHKIKDRIEALIGPGSTQEFYDAWLANHVRKIDIDSLNSWGFNSVRLPMHYNLFTLPIEEEPVPGEHTWLTKGFKLTDSLLSWCKQNEMYVVLDLHAAPGGQGRDEGISDYDTSKPSLWESKANRDKTVALWMKLAERYKDEPWIAGYDLINETNWDMTGNSPLRDLYFELTDSIRTIDQKHILFIEGNWFANDFTGLTPPWDDNMVYSPHKYWSINDQASIQWVLSMRDQYNIPLYFGETGENSNTWFRDAVKLFEEHKIGWAWWPMKKVESIAGPLSWPKSQDYQILLDYWNGNAAKPSIAFAKAALLDMADGMKLENTIYQKDVIDALFRQTESTETVPFKELNIPGIIHATDFDMGPVGYAYFDTEVANYQVSTGNFTSWNNGWSYRNDGVDIEATEETFNSNGYNVGWMSTGEWMQYTADIAEDGIYDVQVRLASNSTDGKFHLSVDGGDATGPIAVPNSGGWQNWQTVTVPNVVLHQSDRSFRFHVDSEGYNLSSMQFIRTGATSGLATTYVSAITEDDQTIQININKGLQGPLPSSPNFQVFVNGSLVSISEVIWDENSSRLVRLKLNTTLRSQDIIRVSYSGNQIQAKDGTNLTAFTQKLVQNTVAIISAVPGRVQAEDYFFQLGMQLENTTDQGGGQNIGFLDVGDYADYFIQVGTAGTYNVNYRTAALSERGEIELQLIENGQASFLHRVGFQATGGWQTWRTTSASLNLPAGLHQIRLVIKAPLFNVNWFEFDLLTDIELPKDFSELKIYPNPFSNLIQLEAELQSPQAITVEVLDVLGKQVWTHTSPSSAILREQIDLSGLPQGIYIVQVQLENGVKVLRKVLKEN